MKRKIEEEKKSNKKTTKTIKYIDLFCGIGGFHLGMKNFNSECVFACDIDKNCRIVYENNFDLEVYGDVSEIDLETIPDHDVLFAGFPCNFIYN